MGGDHSQVAGHPRYYLQLLEARHLLGTSEQGLGYRGHSGQWNVLPSNKGQAKYVRLVTRRNIWGCSLAPKRLSLGLPISVSVWGVFTDFFLANAYSQIVLPLATE